jgi:hypothetical protein
MKSLLYLAFILSSFIANAQYHTAKILMTNGTVKDGLARLPSNKMLDGKVEYKSSAKAKVLKIDEDTISQILYTAKNGNKFLFVRNTVVHLFKSFGKEIVSEKKNKHWMLLIYANDAIKGYSLAQRYKLDKKGIMKSITGAHSIWEFVYFLYQRPTEDKAYIVSGKGFTNGQVKKAMGIYFKDYHALVKRIQNKEWKHFSLTEIAKAYLDYVKD